MRHIPEALSNLDHVIAAMLYPHRKVPPLAENQFEAARILRDDHKSHYWIASALGLSVNQVHCAVDQKAQDRWTA